MIYQCGAMTSPQMMNPHYLKLAKMAEMMSFATEADIIQILDSGYNMNYTVPRSTNNHNRHQGYNVLHFAVENCSSANQNSIMNLLLSRGADFTRKNAQGFTPLRLAYELGKKNPFTKVPDNSMIKLLLSAHYDHYNRRNPRCDHGISHLHIACEANDIETVQFFFESDDISEDEAIGIDSKIFPGCTCLHLAVLNGYKQMFLLLVNYDADQALLNADGKNPMHIAIEKQIHYASSRYESYSCRIANEEIIDELLSLDDDLPNPTDYTGLSHFHVWCARTCELRTETLVEYLNNGVNINAALHLDSPLYPGYSALHFAAHCNFTTVKFLLERGANLLAEDARGTTPLSICLDKYNPSEIGRVLKTQIQFEPIRLESGVALISLLSKLDSIETFDNYLKSYEVNTRIPLDSPLWPGYSLLHLAVALRATCGNSRIEVCLWHGVDLTAQDVNNMTALHLAFHLKKKAFVHEILYACANTVVNLEDRYGLSHFHIACVAGNIKIVKKFLSHGVNPNQAIQADVQSVFASLYPESNFSIEIGSTPLHVAVAIESDDLVKLLLEHGANPWIPNAHGLTVVHQAFLSCKRYNWLESCFTQHPDVLQNNPVAPGGLSHFHVACHFGNVTAAQALLPLTSNISQPITAKLMTYIKKLPSDVHVGDTPLHLATRTASVDVVELLLKNGADVWAKNAGGLKPLHVALTSCRHELRVIRLLLEFEKKEKWSDDTGLTELHVACVLRDESMIERLLIAGDKPNNRINVDSAVMPGYAPLYVLIENGYPEDDNAIKLLLKYILRHYETALTDDHLSNDPTKRQKILALQKDELAVNLEELTAFHISCMTDDAEIVEKFLNLGIDINEPNDNFALRDAGFYPLHFAVKYKRQNVIEMLLKYGAYVECENKDGNTVLHLAASTSPDLLHLLLRPETKFDLAAVNIFKKSILDCLIENKNVNSNHMLEIFKYQSTVKNLTVVSRMYIVERLTFNVSENIFQSLISSVPYLSTVDENGLNFIHFIALAFKFLNEKINWQNELERKIELLEDIGCNLDHQNNEGEIFLTFLINISIKLNFRLLLPNLMSF
ncbi:ankyrin-2-like [Copidosoma floridanum]|uniref:ankyrin-2-like n=1 Tax=Copidosoma floridanum TaxID=29053 RepID=UPI000C6FC9C7|nr:ankyrin-2-like [Copidosoma floridanum]